MFAYTRGLATATKAKEVLPLKGIKVLDMTRVLAGVSSFSSFFLFHFLRSSLAFSWFLCFLWWCVILWGMGCAILGGEVQVVRLKVYGENLFQRDGEAGLKPLIEKE
jgi:hypothetical protein